MTHLHDAFSTSIPSIQTPCPDCDAHYLVYHPVTLRFQVVYARVICLVLISHMSTCTCLTSHACGCEEEDEIQTPDRLCGFVSLSHTLTPHTHKCMRTDIIRRRSRSIHVVQVYSNRKHTTIPRANVNSPPLLHYLSFSSHPASHRSI